MSNIFLAGTGYWKASEIVTNEEIVASFNSYVERFNNDNADQINSGAIEALGSSSTEFIEKASGIKTRHVIDKKGILDINKMMPSVVHEDASKMSIHAEVGIKAALKALDNAKMSASDIDAVILGTSHAARNYPSVAIEIQNELGIKGYAYDMLVGCSSTTFAINNAISDIYSGVANNVLVINPEYLHLLLTMQKEIYILFLVMDVLQQWSQKILTQIALK